MHKYRKYIWLAMLALGMAVTCFLLATKRPVAPVLPVPNGYVDLIRAAQNATSREHRAQGEGSDAELRELVNANRSALALARLGSRRECRVTTDYGRKYGAYAAEHMPVLAQFKKLALAFRSEGELAEREGKTNEAVHIYLDGIRFGQEFCRGGLVIDRLVGVSCEAINFGALSNLVENLDAKSCREAAQVLAGIDARREPWEVTEQSERMYFRLTASLRDNLFGTVQRLVRWGKSWRGQVQGPRQKAERIHGWERRLLMTLAARAYKLETGAFPTQAADLVPAYLPVIPKDPVTGQELAL